MKTVILRGQEIKIGSKVRYIDDKDLYTFDVNNEIKKPSLGKVYTVRGYSARGFYLEEIVNPVLDWYENGKFSSSSEPGFGLWRFEPFVPLYEDVKISMKIEKPVEERIERKVLI